MPGVPDASAKVRRLKPEVEFFSGFAVVGDELVHTLARFQKIALRPGDVTVPAYAGCYTAAVRMGDRVVVTNDLFALCPVFYFHREDCSLISNRSHLIVKVMAQLGITRRPNQETIATLLSSSHLFFVHPYRTGSVLEGLELCPGDSYVAISSDGRLEIIRKRELDELATVGGGASTALYRDLIECAAHQIRANVRAVAYSDAFSYRIVDLSGGKDSRLVFGTAAAEGLLSRCVVRSSAIPSPTDRDTGAAIAERFGAHFDGKAVLERYSKSTSFALGFWRSMIAGNRHEIGANNWPTLWQRGGAVRLGGGCAEICRDFWSSDGLLANIGTQERFNRICRPGLSQSKRNAAFESVWRVLRSMPGDTAEAKVRTHYRLFRSRFHFGMPAFNAWYGYVPFAPIQSPALLNASRLLDENSREKGRVIHDVTELIMPELNRIPFGDGSKWPAEFRTAAGWAASITLPKFAGQMQREHARAEAARKRSMQQLSRRVDVIAGARTIQEALWGAATAALAEMRVSSRDMAEVFDDSFIALYGKHWRERTKHAVETASKILNIYDFCFDSETRALDIVALPTTERYGHDAYASVTVIRLGAAT